MTIDTELLIRQIHDAGRRLVLAVTGGGSQAISQLLAVPGASRSIVEARVPYAGAALVDWLHWTPEQFCSERTARAMAMAGYLRGRQLEPGPDRVLGIGCTASLASDRPKQGAHRVHLSAQSSSATATLSLELVKNCRSRAVEEELTARLILNLIAQQCGLNESVDVPLLPEEQIETTLTTAPAAWQDLLAGKTQRVCYFAPQSPLKTSTQPQTTTTSPLPSIVFPGSFNPLHEGHRQMAAVAERLLGQTVAYEISVLNVEKPPLDYREIELRSVQFSPGTLWLTRAPTIVEKAQLFPGATFIVGADTVVRIADPRYYHGDQAAALAAIAAIAAAGCRFLVFGRTQGDDFRTLGELELPPQLRQLCREVPEAEFRADISSTELRSQQAQNRP